MDYIDKNNKIVVTRGNSFEFNTFPFNSDTGEEIILGDSDMILFCIKTPTDRTVFKQILKNTDYDEDGKLTISMKPSDTMVQPYTYVYGLTYIADDESKSKTYMQSTFTILPSTGTIDDLPKPEPEPDPDDTISDTTDNEEVITPTDSGVK